MKVVWLFKQRREVFNGRNDRDREFLVPFLDVSDFPGDRIDHWGANSPWRTQ